MLENKKIKFWIVVISCLAGALGVVYFINVKPVVTSYNAQAAMEKLKQKKAAPEIKKNLKAIEDWGSFGQTEAAYHITGRIVNYAAGAGVTRVRPLLEWGEENIKQAIKKHPQNPRLYIRLGGIYRMFARKDSVFEKDSQEAYLKAHKLAPKRPGPYYKLVELKLETAKPGQAMAYAKKAIDLNPDYARSWWYLAKVQFYQDKTEKGVASLMRAFEKGLVWRYAGALSFVDEEGLREFAGVGERYLKAAHNDVKIHSVLVMVYQRLGETNKARRHLKQAIEIDPAVEGEFMEMLRVRP